MDKINYHLTSCESPLAKVELPVYDLFSLGERRLTGHWTKRRQMTAKSTKRATVPVQFVNKAKERLAALEQTTPKQRAKAAYTKMEFVGEIAEIIQRLIVKGFPIEQIVENADPNDEHITTSLVQSYLRRMRDRANSEKIAKLKRTEPRLAKAIEPKPAKASNSKQARAPEPSSPRKNTTSALRANKDAGSSTFIPTLSKNI